MFHTIHSIPEKCPNCGAENLGGHEMLAQEQSNTLFCRPCGAVMVLQEPYDDEEEPEVTLEVSASFVACPHCHTIDEVRIEGGEEWCTECGLDPSRQDYPPEDLAHLWKPESGIRESMERGRPKVSMTQMYKFLTTFCGPHCSFESVCPQSIGNFVVCYRETGLGTEEPDLPQIEGTELGKKKRKSRKARREEQERISKEKERAVLVYASDGWYHTRYYSETKEPQKSTHTESETGT